MTESALKLESGVAVSNAAYAPVERKRYVDVFRGLLIAHMALDHEVPLPWQGEKALRV